MKSISIQYRELKEGKIDKFQFLRNARMIFPTFITNQNSFEDSVKILKNKGLLNEGTAISGIPYKEPVYNYPEEKIKTKYKKVENSPEVAEQDGIYPATTLTDIPKEKIDKKIKSTADGLEPIKDKDTKNEMKKIRIIKDKKKTIKETLGNNTLTDKQVMALAKKAGDLVIDAKEDLMDLIVSYGENIPKKKVKDILAGYDILISDLKSTRENYSIEEMMNRKYFDEPKKTLN